MKNTQHNQHTRGPTITVVGTNIDGADAQIPADGIIQVAFDRYLLPSTITRQSYALLDSSRKPLGGQPLRTVYDPVARVVTIAGPEGPGKPWLTEGQTYRLFLPIPRDDQDIGGFRAIDRATLAQEREYIFRAGPPTKQTQIEPAIDFCADILPLFEAKCSGPDCHGATARPAASLILQTADGVNKTARNRVAQGANTSGRSYSPEPPDKVFGVNMAIIAPQDPGSSWLMYKVELAPQPVLDAGSRPNIVCTPPPNEPPVSAPTAATYQPLTRFQVAADDVERAILNDYVLGREMPYPYPGQYYSQEDRYFYTPLTFQEREQIRIWIAHGAQTRECGTCDVVTPGDGGTAAIPPSPIATDAGDAGVTDASDQ